MVPEGNLGTSSLGESTAQNLGDQKYIYVSPDKRVKIIMVDEGEVVKISGDVRSNSRPDLYHHVLIFIKNGWVKWSCSCESGSFGYLCDHVKELFNVYRKNFVKFKQTEKAF